MMRGVRTVLACGLIVASLAGCGGEEDIGAQNDRIADELLSELDSASFETEFDSPSDVACGRPRPGRFQCTAYTQVADDVALTAEYTVVDCEFGWRARATDSHANLTVPAKLEHEREIDVTCPWASSGSFLELEEEE